MTFHPLFGSLVLKPSWLWNGTAGNSEVLGSLMFNAMTLYDFHYPVAGNCQLIAFVHLFNNQS